MAFEEPPQCQETPAQRAARSQGLDGVFRARWMEATGVGQIGRKAEPVQPDTPDQQSGHRGTELRN